jgi:predicted ATPase
MDSAASIASDETITPEDVKRSIFSLTAKSLVTTDASGPNIRYRLLLLTRVYATEKLHDTGEWLRLVRRHAEHFRDFMDAAQARWMDLARAEWLLEYSYAIDDIRTAMDWAFSPNGDVEMGASLAVGSLPFGNQMSLTDEFKRRVQLALDELSRRGPAHTIDEVRLTAALCNLNLNAIVSMSSMRGTFARVAELSKNILLPRDKIEPLLQQAFFLIEIGDYDASLRITQELGDSARAAEDPLAVLLADRVSAQTHHWAGDHIRARELAERVLRHPAKKIPLVYSRSSVDRRVSMRALLARLSWLEGRTDLAIQLIDEAMELAEKDGPFATCQTLALCACPIALWTGDITKAAVLIKQLLDLSERYALERWQRLGECFDAVLVRRTTETGAMQPHYFAPQPAGVMQLELLITTDASLVDDDIAQRAKGGLSGWGNPEMLRAVGERYLREAKPRLGDAELTFIAALDNARHQKALAWEFRAAVSLGELWFGQNRFSDACTLLDPLMERFADQPETSDFRAAKDLLSRCTTC